MYNSFYRYSVGIILLLIFLFANFSVMAVEPENKQQQAMQAFKQKDYVKALGLFLSISDDSARHYYNIGVCYYRLNSLMNAQLAFERAAADTSDKNVQSLAYYNLALVAAKLEQAHQVEYWLDRLNPSTSNQKLLALSDALRLRITGKQLSLPWQGEITFGAGIDDNVLLITDTTSGASDVSDEFFQTQASLTGLYPKLNGNLAITVGAFLHRYPSNSQFNSSNLFVSTNRQLKITDVSRIELGGAFYKAFLDGAEFSQTFEFSLQRKVKRRKDSELRTGVSFANVSSQNSIYAGINGQRERFRIVAERKNADERFSMAYQLELNQRDDDANSPNRHKISVNYKLRLSKNVDVFTGLQWRESDYKKLHKDERWRFDIRTSWYLHNAWRVSARLRHTNNLSNNDAFKYRQNEAGVFVSYFF